jgi:F-type H+-transporting ATPase subunit a
MRPTGERTTQVAQEAHSEGGGLVFHPLDQFIVKPLFGPADGAVHWYTPTNVTLWMAFAVLGIYLLMAVGTRGRAIVPTRVQSVAELIFGFVYKMVEDVTGHDGVRFFPYVITIFLFIFFANFLGLIPMSFTPTSHIAVTAVLGFGVFIAVTVLGFVLNGPAFLGMFWMKDAPLILRPIIAVIEVISYFVRPVSHSVRLAGNIMAGHAVLKVFYGLEVLVAAIQAYVFTILTCVYLKDAVHPHH